MSLGTTISRLRAAKNLSQGELADALGVSRQSVSKWETDASVPELDKLVKLSGLFGITLDELVTGKPPRTAEAAPSLPPAHQVPASKIAAIVLLCMAFLVWLVLTVLGGAVEGLVLATPFLLCAAVCFFVRRRAGFWCGWVLYGAADILLYFCTSLRWRFLFRPVVYEAYSGLHFILAFVQLGVMAALVAATVHAFRKEGKRRSKRELGALWLLWAAVELAPLSALSHGFGYGYLLLDAVQDFSALALFAASLAATLSALHPAKGETGLP